MATWVFFNQALFGWTIIVEGSKIELNSLGWVTTAWFGFGYTPVGCPTSIAFGCITYAWGGSPTNSIGAPPITGALLYFVTCKCPHIQFNISPLHIGVCRNFSWSPQSLVQIFKIMKFIMLPWLNNINQLFRHLIHTIMDAQVDLLPNKRCCHHRR